MSQQKELLREMAAAHNSGAPDRISEWFTEDFRLLEPGVRLCRSDTRGQPHAGALQDPDAADRPGNPRYDREGDRVAVRWQLTATYEGKPFEQSVMAICRFEKGRIAEDWGISIHALWP